jgi:hypothetical protein
LAEDRGYVRDHFDGRGGQQHLDRVVRHAARPGRGLVGLAPIIDEGDAASAGREKNGCQSCAHSSNNARRAEDGLRLSLTANNIRYLATRSERRRAPSSCA